jgi:TolA-binding protein
MIFAILRGQTVYSRASYARFWVIAWCLLGTVCVPATTPQAAQAQEEKSSPEALASYADAANFQNNGAFDLAVEEWTKFLTDHPKDPLAAKARHYSGVCQKQLKQYDKAAEAFAEVVKKYPKFELLDDTLLNLGWCQWTLGTAGDAAQLPKAVSTLETLVADHPESKLLDQALYFLGEANYAQGKRAEAVAAYGRLAKDFPKSDKLADALYASGVANEELSQWAEAKGIYERFLEDFKGHDLTNEIRLRRAEAVLQLGDPAAAFTLFANIAATPNSPYVDRALFRQALCLAKQNKNAEAAAAYAKVIRDFPKSTYAADSLSAAGLNWYRAGNLAEAATWLEQAVAAANDKSVESAHWLAKAYLRQKQFDKALKVADDALSPEGKLKAAGSPFGPALRLDRSDALFELPNQREAALTAYTALADELPQNEIGPQARYNAAFAALELRKLDDALKQVAAFTASYPKDGLLPDAKYVESECYLLKNEPAKSEAILADLLKTSASHQEAKIWIRRLAIALQLQGKHDQVIATLSPALATFDSPEAKAEASYLIGASQYQLGKTDEAVASLEASLAASAKWAQTDEVLLALARAERKLNQNDKAIAALEMLVKELPQSSQLDQARYRIGEIRFAAEDYPAALAMYDEVLAKNPTSTLVPYALFGRGWSLLKQKKHIDATASFSQLLEKYPQHDLANETRAARAMCRRIQGDAAGALDDLNAFLKTNVSGDKRADALYEKGLVEVAKQDFASAVATFTSIVKDFPSYAALDRVLYELAWAYKSNGNATEAVEQFARVVKDFPNSSKVAEAHLHVGEDQYTKKQYAAAAASYTKAKELAGDVAENREKATYMLGWCDYHMGKFEAAFGEFNEQLTKYPDGTLAGDAVFMKAECLFKAGKYADAWTAYQEAGKGTASTPLIEQLILLHGGQSAIQQKQWADATAWLQKLVEKHPKSNFIAEAKCEAGWSLQNQGKLDEAIPLYTAAAAASRGESGARARFLLGEAYFEQKKHADAIREFQRVMFGYGADKAPAEVQNWQAKSGFEAGRCTEVQIIAATDATQKAKLIAEAKKHYQFVVEKHAQNAIAADAKKRLDELAKL